MKYKPLGLIQNLKNTAINGMIRIKGDIIQQREYISDCINTIYFPIVYAVFIIAFN